MKTGEGSKNPMYIYIYMWSQVVLTQGVWMVLCYIDHILLLIYIYWHIMDGFFG